MAVAKITNSKKGKNTQNDSKPSRKRAANINARKNQAAKIKISKKKSISIIDSGLSPESDTDNENTERYELALRATNQGVWDWRIDKGRLECTPKFIELLAYKLENLEIFFEKPEGFVDKMHIEVFKIYIEKQKNEKSGAPSEEEFRIRKGDGSWGWFRLRCMTVFCPKRKTAIRMVGTIIDITKRKIAEEKLLQERHLFRTLMNNLPVNVFVKDLQSRFTIINKSIIERFGKNRESEVIGRTDYDFYDREHAKQSFTDEQLIIRNQKPIINKVETETWDKKPDSYVLTTKMPYYDVKGELKGIFGVSSDVSELMHIQKQLHNAVNAAERKNKELDEELNLARQLQNAFLPRKYPKIQNNSSSKSKIDFCYKYLPMISLGGDFFEIFQVSESKVGVFIADVMGHGVRSALVVSIMRGLIQNAREQGDKPAKLLENINRSLFKILRGAKLTLFSTAFYAVFDFEKNKLRYATAAHPRPILVSRDKSVVEFLPRSQSLKSLKQGLGLFYDANFQTAEYPLEKNSVMIFYTDGIFDLIEEAGIEENKKFLINSLYQSLHKKPKIILDKLVESAEERIDSKVLPDDVCLVAAEIKEL